MRKAGWVGVLTATGLLAGCRDAGLGPDPNALPDDRGLSAAQYSVLVDGRILAQAAGPELDTYAFSFWATRDRATSIQVRYRDDQADDDAPGGIGSNTFLHFYLPAGALYRRPDGRRLTRGDSIEITATVDGAALLVRFEPSGLEFSAYRPARLFWSYAAADPDFDGDGDLDERDVAIARRLGLWTRQGPDDIWRRNHAYHSLNGRWVLGFLHHFTDYAISW